MSFHIIIIPIGVVSVPPGTSEKIYNCPTVGAMPKTVMQATFNKMPSERKLLKLFPKFEQQVEAQTRQRWQKVIELIGGAIEIKVQHFEAFIFDQKQYDAAIKMGGKFAPHIGAVVAYVDADTDDPAAWHAKLFAEKFDDGSELFTPYGPTLEAPLKHYRFDSTTLLEVHIA